MTVMSLDRIDIKILNELQQNASLTNVELAGDGGGDQSGAAFSEETRSAFRLSNERIKRACEAI